MNSNDISTQFAPRLRAAGLRVTQPRLAILGVLRDQTTPISVEDLHAGLDASQCDLVTVYRCLDAFEAIGLVKRYYRRNGTTVFAATAGHPLFVMSERGCQVAEIGAELTNAVCDAAAAVERHLQQRGFRDVRAVVQFFAEPPPK